MAKNSCQVSLVRYSWKGLNFGPVVCYFNACGILLNMPSNQIERADCMVWGRRVLRCEELPFSICLQDIIYLLCTWVFWRLTHKGINYFSFLTWNNIEDTVKGFKSFSRKVFFFLLGTSTLVDKAEITKKKKKTLKRPWTVLSFSLAMFFMPPYPLCLYHGLWCLHFLLSLVVSNECILSWPWIPTPGRTDAHRRHGEGGDK